MSKYCPIDKEYIDKHIVSLLEPYSFISEQFKHLRTELISLKERDNINMLMITSPSQGEGKSLISLNLAISLSLTLKDTVLLIEADLRKPSIVDMLGIKVEKGLSDYLASDDITIPDILIKTDINKLTIMPAGLIPPNPSELLGSDKMLTLLKDIKGRYPNRFILIDSPPILVATDAAVIGPKTDGAILIVCSQKTRKDEIEGSLTLLKDTKMLGIVLNKSDSYELKSKEKKGYQYYYNYNNPANTKTDK